jgi:S1-C subfamily serine protease
VPALRHFFSILISLLACLIIAPRAFSAPLPDLIDNIRPSIVGVGTIQATRRPPSKLLGTGFVIGDGHLIATNAHVLPKEINTARKEFIAVFIGRGNRTEGIAAEVVGIDEQHDLAILKINGDALPAVTLGNNEFSREGTQIAFTGFPIGAVLGLYPVTHTGIVSVITPIVIPARSSGELTAKQIKFLRSPYDIYQLDATAYPGNSGSPMYETTTGKVIGIINMVFVKDKKENILKDPSAITYAIPVRYLHELLESIQK